MNDKVGRKIKDLAKTISIIMIILSVLLGLLIIGNGVEWLGVILIILGCVLARILNWFIYGFGELIDKAVDIEYNTRAIAYNTQKDNTQKDEQD